MPSYNLNHIDGLNVSDTGFNWKGIVILTNGRRPNENIAEAWIRVSEWIRPYGKNGPLPKLAKLTAEGMRTASLFLSCYCLSPPKKVMAPRVIGSGAFLLKEPEQIHEAAAQYAGISSHQSTMQKCPIDETMKNLKLTIPLFEKVMSLIEKKPNYYLLVALLMYYRALQSNEAVEDFIDLVTALEALYSDGSQELRYKVALRASIFTVDETNKRRPLFDKLKHIYDARSALVHGSVLPLEPYGVGEYSKYKQLLIPTVEISLRKYIELAYKGSDKETILQTIDNHALGFSESG